jgi:peptide/nickel transport system substrate-binding protein
MDISYAKVLQASTEILKTPDIDGLGNRNDMNAQPQTTRTLSLFRHRWLAACLLFITTPALASDWTGSPALKDAVSSGALPPVAERLPATPRVVQFGEGQTAGEYGGSLRLLMGKAKDIRQMTIYGYARLVAYDTNQELQPDIVESFDVQDNRVFTFTLRQGHKWSDGAPFTSEDFRYFWEDIILNEELAEGRMESALKVDGKLATFEVVDERTVRYSWEQSNPYFLPAIAGPNPLYLYKPAHYLSQFHKQYIGEEAMAKMVEESGKRNWMAVHHGKDRPYKQNNPKLPTLQPWLNTTKPPSDRFVFKRNPFFHRIDSNGKQLPYIDEVVIAIASNKLIAAKAGAGEADLQARYIRLDNYPFLKKGSKQHPYDVHLWSTAKGSQLALYPNLNAKDDAFKALMRNADFRRALSMGVNRKQINQVVYFGLAKPSNNTVVSESSLYKPEYAETWTQFDVKAANQLLDNIGLTERDDRGIRKLPDGRPLEIPVQTAGESTEQTDVLELIHDSWLKIGVKLFSVPSQREVFRSRVFSGEAIMAIWGGLENGLPSATSVPRWIAPTSKYQYQWPKWGEFVETGGRAGEAPDLPEGEALVSLYNDWRMAASDADREAIWHEMLAINTDQVFSIGIVNGVKQPVVVNKYLNNVPKEGIYDISVTAYFGVYQPDTFWFSKERQ